jgi:2-C-methyl-D-erythritol 4-phosphate cytidylyltransferase
MVTTMSLFSLLKNSKQKKPPTCTAVIAAAGTSQRCKGEDKLYYLIDNKPVLAYTLDVFQSCKLIDDIIIVAQEERYKCVSEICSEYGFDKVSKIMKGGLTRSQSVINGIFAASSKAGLIAIHDGGRPCIDPEILERTVIAASLHHAAAPAVSITSTIKKVNEGFISETVSREGLYEIQTPQIFQADIIKAALTNAMNKSIAVTDDCMAVELIGIPVRIVEGSRMNIKITDNNDLKIAEAFLSGEKLICE